MDEVLDERKRKILKAIIKTYMETGEPVGSRIHFLIPLRRRNYQQILSFAHPSDEVLL